MPDSAVAKNVSRASDAAEKHDRYFLTLTFTLLAASVQTAQWTHNRWVGALEIVGWVLFATSGILGLYRDQQTPIFFQEAAESAAAKETGDATASHPAGRLMAEVSYGLAETLDSKLKAKSKKLRCLYEFQWRLFVGALLILIFRRGIVGLELF